MSERKEKFTPGPWEVVTAQKGYPYEPTKEDFLRYCGDCWDDSVRVDESADGWGVVRSESIGAVICVFGNGPTTWPNAHLIAALPELYEVVARFEDYLHGRFDLCDGRAFDDETERLAKAALAKARGEA